MGSAGRGRCTRAPRCPRDRSDEPLQLEPGQHVQQRRCRDETGIRQTEGPSRVRSLRTTSVVTSWSSADRGADRATASRSRSPFLSWSTQCCVPASCGASHRAIEPVPHPRSWTSIALVAGSAPVLAALVAVGALVLALLQVAESFGRDIWWLWRHRADHVVEVLMVRPSR